VVHLEKANTRSFKDCDISVVELKTDVFETLYAWMAAYNSAHFSSFTSIFGLMFFFSLIGGLSCIFFVYSGFSPLHFQ
jgi:hypothetical protein